MLLINRLIPRPKGLSMSLMPEMSEYELMQAAVDYVPKSEHPTNKVAAALGGLEYNGTPFSLVETNYWPKAIAKKIGRDIRIGNASGTVHAETACLLATIGNGQANSTSMYVTDLPCPNCVKNMAESGVRKLYIDHKGFTKDFALRRGGHFENMSLRICEKANIGVYKIFRKEKRIETILEIQKGFSPVNIKPSCVSVVHKKLSRKKFRDLIEQEKEFYEGRPFAMALETSPGKIYNTISAEAHPCPGYTEQTIEQGDEKYSTILQPLNRVMMRAVRNGHMISPHYIYSSHVPTARELVDMVGMLGVTKLTIGDVTKSRDAGGLQALKQLVDAKIITIKT
ncbi:MAG: deoxycytidylate deaminase [Alphaproteobacteria bacterium PRO2]|nr:deoxycytidylate deaminase [Alphaproteobacteria bacterium PRO2]